MKAKYVRWPGDADPSDPSFVRARSSVEYLLRRGPLRTLIHEGYVSEVIGENIGWMLGIVLVGPEGHHRIFYWPDLNKIAVREHESNRSLRFDDARFAAAYFRAIVDWDEKQDSKTLARIMRLRKKAILI